MNAAIAQHLNVPAAAILEVQVWARVLWVRVKGLGARFVSKKVGQVVIQPKKITYNYPTGQRIEMLYSANRQSYQIYVDGTYNQMIPVQKALEGFAKMTESQLQSANVQFTY